MSMMDGINYPYTAFDNEEKFKQRINNSSTMIDKSGGSYTVKGGYYINAEKMEYFDKILIVFTVEYFKRYSGL